MSRASLIATIAFSPSSDGRELAALARAVEWLEVRAGAGEHPTTLHPVAGPIPGSVPASRVSRPDASSAPTSTPSSTWLRNFFGGGLIYSGLTSTFRGDASERREHVKTSAAGYDLIELDADRDLDSETLRAVPPARRLVSWRGDIGGPRHLVAALDRLYSVDARYYKLTPRVRYAGDVVTLLRLVESAGRPNLIAYAEGEGGFWSRLVTPRLVAPMIYGLAGLERGTGEEPSIEELIGDYGLPELRAVEEVYGIVGNPVRHSLSPRLHNAAYRTLGLPALFLPFQVESFDDFWRDVVRTGAFDSLGMPLRGLTVVSPYKEAALVTAGESSAVTRRIDAANIFVRNNGHWRADTTDPEGVVLALRGRGISLRRRRTAVIGCGGAGRAVAAALDEAGADVTLVNRGLERGRLAVRLLGLPFVPLAEFEPDGYSMVVNATPVGRDGGGLPFSVEGLNRDAVVVDLVYGAAPTPLITSSVFRGLDAVDGREVLLIQAQRQFQMMTGREMPTGLARDVLAAEASQRCATV